MARFAFLHGSNDLYGASRVLVDDVEILRDRGHAAVVLLPEDGPLTERLESVGAQVEIHSLRVLRKVDGPSGVRLPVVLPRAVRGADVVVTWTLALSGYLPALRFARKAVIASVHEILDGRAGTILASGTGRLAHVLMTNSKTTSEWLVRSGVPADRLHLAYPEAPAFDPLPAVENAPPAFTALLAGRVNGHKGHIEAVRAAKLVGERGVEFRLLLLGGAFPGQEAHLEALLKEANDVPGVEYLGEVAEIRPHLAVANAMLVPTTRPEPFGIVALEGWASGRRVIASDQGGLAEATRMVEGVAVPAGDVDALAEAILRVANDPDLRGGPSADAEASRSCTREARTAAWLAALAAIGLPLDG